MIGARDRLVKMVHIIQMPVTGQTDILRRHRPPGQRNRQEQANGPRIPATEREGIIELLYRH